MRRRHPVFAAIGGRTTEQWELGAEVSREPRPYAVIERFGAEFRLESRARASCYRKERVPIERVANLGSAAAPRMLPSFDAVVLEVP